MTSFYTNVFPYGNRIFYREVDSSGKRKVGNRWYKPTLFLPSKSDAKYRTVSGKSLEPIRFDSIKETREFIDQYKDVHGFEFFGNERYDTCFISDRYPGEIEFDKSHLVVCNFDIEIDTEHGMPDFEAAREAIVSIAVHMKNKYWVFGITDEDINLSKGTFVRCEDERDLLIQFADLWTKHSPDIVTGWNVQFFDIPYLLKRMQLLIGEDSPRMLSPYELAPRIRRAIIHGKEQIAMSIPGVAVLDYFELYKKFTYTQQESYRLDYIAQEELGARKLAWNENYQTMYEFFKSDYQTFLEYNLRDVELVKRLDEKMGFIDMVLELAYSAKVNFVDVFSQVKMWDAIIFHDFREKNIVVPRRVEGHKDSQYAGAFVKPPQVGLHEWVVSYDLNALYPNLILQHNISPEKLRGERAVDFRKIVNGEIDEETWKFLNERSLSLTANGWTWDRKEDGIFPVLVRKLIGERFTYKNEMMKAKSELESVEKEMRKRGIL